MNEQKSPLVEMAEVIDRYLRRPGPQEAGAPPAKRGSRWLRWLGRQMIPNLGTLLLVMVLLVAVPSLAAPLRAPLYTTSTSTISYQGRLADSAGNPLTGKYDLEFRIYDVPTGGTPLWTEMWTGGNAVDVSDGLFNVMLGSINNTLASAIEGHDELYLGITVGTDSEMTPRVQLGSVPFSFQAMTAQSLSGQIATQQIADSAVTSRKANLVSQFNAQDALGATTSTTWTYFTNRLRVTVNLETQQYVQIMYSVVAYSSSPGPGDVRSMTIIFVDDVEQDAVSYGAITSTTGDTIARVYQVQLPAGSHEIEVRFKSGNSGNTATFERGTLLATVLSTSGGN